jgi:hypothetical protein
MTTQQLYLINCLYLVALVLVAFFTRATARRIAGALVGGVAVSVMALGADALGEELGWWRMAVWGPHILPLVCLSFVVSVTPIYLVTWRVARKFGRRGLVVVVVALTVIGPPRDYAYMARFPEWGSYAPGVVPVLAIAAIYAMLVPLGHSLMRLVAGPAKTDRLARRPWESA